MIFEGLAKFLKAFSNFNPRPFLPFVETYDGKQFQCLYMVFK